MKGKKKWTLLLIVLLLSGCLTDDSPTPKEAGREIIDLLLSGELQTVFEQWFDEKLQKSLPLETLKETWKNQVEMSGEFIEVSSLEASKRGEKYEVIEAALEYTNVIFDVRMIFNELQRLVGFHLSEGISNASLPNSLVEEEVIVGEGTPFELNGTLTLPKQSNGNLPAVVLVHGSGPSDQDETVYAYKPFRDLAWGLAQQGIAVIRYDKRTYAYGGKMAQDENNFTAHEETVEDAIRATQLLKGDDRIDENNVYILGHSLGGMLAPRIDAEGGDFAGIIIFAGSPRPLWDIVYDQNINLLESGTMDESVKKEQEELVEAEYEKAQQLQDMTDEEAKEETVFGINGYYLKEMDQFDMAILPQLGKPLLIMQGEDDFQVYYEKDFIMWKELLEGYESATFLSYPNLNHFFVNYDGPEKGTVKEYEVPGQVDSEVIQDIGKWILNR